MTPFASLSELARSFFSLALLAVCVTGIFGVTAAVSQRRLGSALAVLFPFAGGYFLWQAAFDIHLCGSAPPAAPASLWLGALTWLCWAAALAVLGLVEVFALIRVVRRGRQSITPAAVKLCMDMMPCGVCYWRDNGRVLFSNLCMNDLCVSLTGSPLLNGNHLGEAVSGGIERVGDRVWRFTHRGFFFDGADLHELIASDVTAEYARTQALEEDRKELSRLNRELRDYNLSIDETVRRQEILQAKVNIHDEMNRLMLSTMSAGSEDDAALDRIISLWGQNALLLCMQADGNTDSKAATRVEKLAEALKMDLVWTSPLPAALSAKQRELFFAAAQEAVANAAKHARAKTLSVSFEESDSRILCRFANDGDIPSGEVRFAGGLANLSRLAGDQGAGVSVSVGEAFTLTLSLPKECKNQPIG